MRPIYKKILLAIAAVAIVLGLSPVIVAAAPFLTAVGGTGSSTPSGIMYGDNGATSHLNTLVIGANLTLSGGTLSATGGSSAFSTTSTDFWQTQRNFFATTSADYWKTQNNFFSTTSAAYWKSVTDLFSTTSATFFLSTQSLFSTTSADYLQTQRNYFSTTSASYFLAQNQAASFATTSAIFFTDASTTIPKTYKANTYATGALQTIPYASTTAITASTASTSLLFVNGLGGCSAGQYLTWTAGAFGCASDQTTAGAPDFTFASTFGTSSAATSSPVWIQNQFNASSTSNFSATSTFWSAIKVGNSTARSNLVQVDCNQDWPLSISVGGCVNITNTNNAGPAFQIYTNHGASAGAPLLRIRDDNSAFDQEMVTLQSTSDTRTTLGITGSSTSQGVVKITHNYGVSSDANVAALSIDTTGAGTAAMGIFIDATGSGGSSGNKIVVRNGGTGINEFVVNNTGWVGIASGTPGVALAVDGQAIITNQVTGKYFTATSTGNASTFPYASSTALTMVTGSTTNLIVSSAGGTGTRCAQFAADGTISASASACGSLSSVTINTSGILTGGGTGSSFNLNASSSPTLGSLQATSTTATSTFAGPVRIIPVNNTAQPVLMVGTSTNPVYGPIAGDLIDAELDWNGTTGINAINGGVGSCASTGLWADGNIPALNSNYAVLAFLNTGWTGSGCAMGNGKEAALDGLLGLPTGNWNFEAGNGAFKFWNGTTQTVTLTSTGNFGIGSTSPGTALGVQGNEFIAGNITSTSSAANVFPYASSTALTAGKLFATSATTTSLSVTNLVSCDTIDTDGSGNFKCGTDATGAGAFPFTPTTNFGALANSTGTPIWFTAGIQSSSTVRFGSAGNAPFFWDNVNGRLGIGTTTPSEILHLVVPTATFGTMRIDSGNTQGYMYAYDGTPEVGFGSNSDAQVNFRQNNSTRAYIGTAGDWYTQNTEGQHTWLTTICPASNCQEATMTTKLDFGGGNSEFVDWTTEDYGTDHQHSINIGKFGTGKLLPLSIRFWNADLTNIAANGYYAQVWMPGGNIGFGVPTTTMGFGYGTTTFLYGASSTAQNLFRLDTATGTPVFVVTGSSTPRVGISTSSPAAALGVQGNEFIAGNITSTSTTASIFPYASTTAVTASVASSSLLFVNGLGGCSAGQYLTWSAGAFGCAADQSTAGAAPFTYAVNNTFNTTTAATTTASFWTQGVFFSSSTVAASQFPYATSTGVTVSAFWNNGLTSALALFDANHKETAYAGSANPCTNQAPTTISAAGALGGCTSINNSWWSGAQLTIGNGGTGATSFTTSGNGVYYTGSVLATAPTNSAVTYPYASTTAITATTASTTNLIVSGPLTASYEATVGTSTITWGALTVGSSSAPQIILSDNIGGDTAWAFRSVGGTLFFSTSTAAATSSNASLTLLPVAGETTARVGIGTNAPAELLHLSKPSGFFDTMRFDSGATQGYFFSYSGTPEVSMGSNSNAIVNIKVNNSTAWWWDTANKHQHSNGSVPTVSTCAGFTVSTGSNDNAGKITMTAGTTCLMNFNATWANRAPFCTVSAGNAAVAVAATTLSTTQLGITAASNITSWTYICVGSS